MAENYFLLPIDEYKRSINPIQDWIKQTALYASKITGKPFAACEEHLRKKLRNKEIEFNNPKVIHYRRKENGDRIEDTSTLSGYLSETLTNNEILAPTLTTYFHPSVKRSKIAEFLDEGVAVRKDYKKRSQKYEAAGNDALHKYFHNAQDAAKRTNNSASGGMVAEGSVINNPTGHSTLTTVTRSIASLSNASNERLISGNRHYYAPKIALNNIVSIVAEADLTAIKEAIEQYGLVYPSIDETMACVRWSTDFYFRDRKAIASIRELVTKLSDVERAAFVYTGDLYHLRKFNEGAIRQFLTDLSTRGSDTPMEDPVKKIKNTDEQVINYAHQVCISLLAGKGHDYGTMPIEHVNIVANTCANIENVLVKYKGLIKAFFLSKNLPCTIATLPTMQRRCVVLSDTDSTMFSVDEWVKWYFGEIIFDDPCYAVGGAVMFIATQAIAHSLAVFSVNVNVEGKRMFTLAMKPEFVFPVFAQTPVAKHYYTATKVKEGNVWPDIKMEIKGVHMKDSSVPTNIIDSAAKIMESNIRTIMSGEKLSLADTLKKTADLEREITASLYKGETRYLKWVKIKEKTAYALEEDKSPYQYYKLWEEVFAPSYSAYGPPPYQAVRIPLDLKNKTMTKNWLESCENREFAQRMATWMQEHKKETIGSFPIPMEHCLSHGVPKELITIMDTKKIILSLTKSYRNILSSMGYFPKFGMLISEEGY